MTRNCFRQPSWAATRSRTGWSTGTAAVGSGAQGPDDRLWRVAGPYLEQAQDDATNVAIRDMERAGHRRHHRRGDPPRELLQPVRTALDGMAPEPALVDGPSGRERRPRAVGPIRRSHAVEVRRHGVSARQHGKPVKMTLPGPFTISKQTKNEFYSDRGRGGHGHRGRAERGSARPRRRRRRRHPARRAVAALDPAAAERIAVKAIDRALDGVSVTTVIHLCFGYAALVKAQKPPATHSWPSSRTAWRIRSRSNRPSPISTSEYWPTSPPRRSSSG